MWISKISGPLDKSSMQNTKCKDLRNKKNSVCPTGVPNFIPLNIMWAGRKVIIIFLCDTNSFCNWQAEQRLHMFHLAKRLVSVWEHNRWFILSKNNPARKQRKMSCCWGAKTTTASCTNSTWNTVFCYISRIYIF